MEDYQRNEEALSVRSPWLQLMCCTFLFPTGTNFKVEQRSGVIHAVGSDGSMLEGQRVEGDGAKIRQGYGKEHTIIRMLYPKLYKGIYTKLYDWGYGVISEQKGNGAED